MLLYDLPEECPPLPRFVKKGLVFGVALLIHFLFDEAEVGSVNEFQLCCRLLYFHSVETVSSQ